MRRVFRRITAPQSYVKMLDKSISPIDWNKTPREIVKHIYGLQPWPVATMELEGKTFRVFGADYTDRKSAKMPGYRRVRGEDGITFACADGANVRITELQAPGKKRMKAADFLRGHRAYESMIRTEQRRQAALEALIRCRRDGAWSGARIDAEIKKTGSIRGMPRWHPGSASAFAERALLRFLYRPCFAVLPG